MYVYKFGLSAPVDEASRTLVYDQIRGAHRYRNTLVEIERGRRAAVRAILQESQPEIAKLMQEVSTADALVLGLVTKIKKSRAGTRRRSEDDETKTALKAARRVKWAAVNALREARSRLRDDVSVTAQIEVVSERAAELRRSARAYCGVYWGSYNLIEDEMAASAKMPLYEDDGISPNDPRFIPWRGEGSLGVQIQGGAPAANVLSGKNRFLDMRPDERAYLRRACDRRRVKDKTGRLRLRVGSDTKRKPIWAEWHLDMHRLLPENSIVKRAAIHLHRFGPLSRWSLTVSIEHERPTLPANDAVIAIDIGWRVMGDELRVAGFIDGEGNRGDIRLSAKDIQRLKRPNELRSERDGHFGVAKIRLEGWIAKFPEVPDWMRKETANLGRWNSADRLARLCATWTERRFNGDESIHNEMTAWYWKDHYLSISESTMRESALARRQSLYREIASRITGLYGTIVMEAFDIRPLTRRGDVLADAENETARSNRQLVAVSEFRTAVIDAANARGRKVVLEPAANTTRTCPACGLIESRDAAASVDLTCECGATWDQDVNGAPIILLRRWRESASDAGGPGGTRDGEKKSDSAGPTETRWGKARRMAAEKKGRSETARAEASRDAE